MCRKLLVCGPAFPVLNPCAFEGGSAWIPDVGVEPGCPWLRTTYNALSAFLPLLSSPPSNSHISRVRSAPDWPPRMPLNGGGLGKHFKRKPKSVSHLPPPSAAPRSFLSFSHIHIQLSSGFLSSLLHFSSWSWFMTFPRQTLWPLAPSPPSLSRLL